MASIKLKGDTSGEITISAPAVAGTTTLELPATSSTLATQNALGVRNLIINGDMRIDQRGGSVTNGYSVDRFKVEENSNGGFTGEQSTDAPNGEPFINSLKCTVTTTDTDLGTTQYARVSQTIEGLNIPHLMWGTSEAKTITVSFWVKASVTGTYDFSLQNDASDRTYMTSYTINSANTWEKKTITIAGDTTGTWKTDNDRGIRVYWGLGTGTSYQTSTTGWQSANVLGSDTPNINFLATSGATWYLTGVQLEVGDTATPFEHRPYDMELQRCFRYFEKLDAKVNGTSGSTVISRCHWVFKSRKRATPTIVEVGGAKSGVENTSPDSYGINRTGGNESIIGSGSTADAEL